MAVGIGKRILNAILKATVDPYIGSIYEKQSIIDEDTPTPEAYEEAAKVWEAVGKTIVGSFDPVEYREAILLDGSTGLDSKPLPNHFIPEHEFHLSNDYEDREEDKEDESLIPEFSEGIPGSLDTVRKGYRIVIEDDKIMFDSVVWYHFIAIERGETFNIPLNYTHISPGSTYIVNQKDGEVQIHVQYKSCYKIRYGIYTGEVNKDSVPVPVEYLDLT